MYFTTVPNAREPAGTRPGVAWLGDDNWDDYGFKTVFHLRCYNGSSSVNVGAVKIGSFGMEAGRTSLPRRFEALEPDFFSLGTDESCYATLLDEFDDETRLAIFSGLCDVAHDAELFEQACNEPVMRDSLLRGTDADTVTVIGRPVGGEPTINDEADGVRWILPGELDSYDIHHSMRKQIAHYLDGTFPHVD